MVEEEIDKPKVDGTIESILSTLKSTITNTQAKQFHVSYTAGQNCGSEGKDAAIYVEDFQVSDPVILGGNATISAKVHANREVKSLSLMVIRLEKEGVGEIPCTGNIGSCNYTNPCQLVQKVPCPKVVLQQKWNCRCPIQPRTLSLPPSTYELPTVPLPAFLVNGKYTAKVQLFEEGHEIFCYKVAVMVKEK